MVKAGKKNAQKPARMLTPRTTTIPEKMQDLIFVTLIIILLAFLLKPLLFNGLSPQGADIVAGIGKVKQIQDYNESHDDFALWNPAIFGGMPHYQDYGPVTYSLDTILALLGLYLSSVYVFYLFGALGLYALFRYLKFKPLLAFAGSMMFILLPHYKSLWVVGHFRKLRAIMYIPWIVLTFKYFLDRRTVLAITLFAVLYGLQIRTQHYQIIFYTSLLIFTLGVYPILSEFLTKKYTVALKSLLMLGVAVFLALMMSAQPLFLANEYLPYSKRGKTTIDISKPKEQQPQSALSQGTTLEYATQWSTAPSELLVWIIPRFYGGMSGEKYTGNGVPQLRNQTVPFYWGHMPFTQSYEYIGLITILLAVIGIYACRKNKLIISLVIFAGFLILLSFGRHFESFYSFFYNYLPYFNKFRAPMMSVTVTSFIIVIFALFGLKHLSEIKRGELSLFYKNLLLIAAGFFLIGVVIWLISGNFSFIKNRESYDPKVMNLIKDIRKEVLIDDLVRYMVILVLGFGAIWAYLKEKLSFSILTTALTVLIMIDLYDIQTRYQEKYIDSERAEKNFFRKNAVDLVLDRDKETYRIFPVGQLFQDNRWAYSHQSIGGYSPIKMYTIEEIIQNNLYKGWDQTLPLNWNILKILNVKYLVSPQMLKAAQLTLIPAGTDNEKLSVYYFNDYLSRGFFVGAVEIIEDEFDRLARMNQSSFDPAKTAIIETGLHQPVSVPDSSYSRMITYSPNRSVYEVFTSHQALFVISELYFPPGWKILIDNQQVEQIYKTDHAIQSVIVAEGAHRLELQFEPDSFYRNIWYATISSLLLYGLILGSVVITYREPIRKRFKTKTQPGKNGS
jgi:hypothetical protein